MVKSLRAPVMRQPTWPSHWSVASMLSHIFLNLMKRTCKPFYFLIAHYVGYLETSLWLDQLDQLDQLDHPDYPIHPINLTILTTLATLLHQPDQLFVSFPNPFALSEAENLSDQLYTQIDTSFYDEGGGEGWCLIRINRLFHQHHNLNQTSALVYCSVYHSVSKYLKSLVSLT